MKNLIIATFVVFASSVLATDKSFNKTPKKLVESEKIESVELKKEDKKSKKELAEEAKRDAAPVMMELGFGFVF